MQGYEQKFLIYSRKTLVVDVIVVIVVKIKNIYKQEKVIE